jgi:hypothetical protein
MKVAIVLLVFGTSCLPGGDRRRCQRIDLGQTYVLQFVIHEPDPRFVRNHIRDCCIDSPNPDCHLYDWGIDRAVTPAAFPLYGVKRPSGPGAWETALDPRRRPTFLVEGRERQGGDLT